MKLLALVPAHNEEGTIRATIQSLHGQTRPPDRIIVVADNCSDRTEELAYESGAEVYPTLNNKYKKAGGLNQVLSAILPWLDDEDRILVMDADSVLNPEFLETALHTQEMTGAVVGGVFYGEPGGGLVGWFQRNEYARYGHELFAKNDEAMVLTGTATLHRVDILRHIMRERGNLLPGQQGQVYDTQVLTEDNEITLAIKTLGYQCLSPESCQVLTEVMPTWRDLYHQRLRWQRGAMENLRQYGKTSVTKKYRRQQSMMRLGVLAMWLFLIVTTWQIATDQIAFGWWSLLGLIFVLERMTTLKGRGLWNRLVASTLVLEWFYDMFLQAVLVKAVWSIARKQEASWHHIERGSHV